MVLITGLSESLITNTLVSGVAPSNMYGTYHWAIRITHVEHTGFTQAVEWNDTGGQNTNTLLHVESQQYFHPQRQLPMSVAVFSATGPQTDTCQRQIYIVKFWMRPRGQILSISCSSWGKFGKIVCWCPPSRAGAPTSGKSWIRYRMCNTILHWTNLNICPQQWHAHCISGNND